MTFVHRGLAAALLVLAACRPQGAPPAEAEAAAIRAGVDSAVRAFEAAQRAGDGDAVLAHLDATFFMYQDGVRVGYDSVAAAIRRTFATLGPLDTRFGDVTVLVLSRDAALAAFTFRDAIPDAAGRIVRQRGATTLLWQRRGAQWRITYADADHHPDPAPAPP